MHKLFKDRLHAGKLLAQRLLAYARRPEVIVLALPRGGVPLGAVIARALAVPLDVLLVRKLGVPGYPECAIGAIAGDGQCLLNTGQVKLLGLPLDAIEAEARHEQDEIARRELRYREGRPAPQLEGKIVILVDDGIATGATMQMAIWLARQAKAAKIIVAVPVAPNEVFRTLNAEVDALVCLRTPSPFLSVGQCYQDFEQVSDEQVAQLLRQTRQRAAPQPAGSAAGSAP
ncbi:phosphoribosyl transferase [Duganella rhizosphaerae]|uniref:phosphoribosyltransferase n=1 Tax=Duganella rhizosphaerae TaxID=2885763 RepID=UPI0030E7F543